MRHLRARYAIASRGGSRRQTGWAHYQDALRSETRRRQIAGDAANGAPRGAVASGDGCGSSEQSGHSRITRPAPPGQPGRFLGAPSPLDSGERKRERKTGRPQRPDQDRGRFRLCCLTVEYAIAARTERVSAFTRVHSPSKTGVNALEDALCRRPGTSPPPRRSRISLADPKLLDEARNASSTIALNDRPW